MQTYIEVLSQQLEINFKGQLITIVYGLKFDAVHIFTCFSFCNHFVTDL